MEPRHLRDDPEGAQLPEGSTSWACLYPPWERLQAQTALILVVSFQTSLNRESSQMDI